MAIKARYVHTNIVAGDWRALAAFYVDVLGCQVVPPERHLGGEPLAKATGLAGAAIEGVHLRLPGCGPGGPTLEVFEYRPQRAHPSTAPNRPGLGHIAFAVDDVAAARQAVLKAGGRAVGEVVSLPVSGAGTVTFCYVTDLEGNMIELQQWSA